jgi:hypothetical protein
LNLGINLINWKSRIDYGSKVEEIGKTAREIIKKEAKARINEIYPQIEAEKNLNIYTSIPEITSDRSKNQKKRETLFSKTSKSNEKSINNQRHQWRK